jgi:hypothetical protein
MWEQYENRLDGKWGMKGIWKGKCGMWKCKECEIGELSDIVPRIIIIVPKISANRKRQGPYQALPS